MSRNTVTPRTRVSKATAERRCATALNAYYFRNRALDRDAIKQAIGDRQAFVSRHVPPLDAGLVCERFAQANPKLRAVLAPFNRGPENRQLAMIKLLMAVGVEVVTLAEARAARDVNDLAAGRKAGGNGARLS